MGLYKDALKDVLTDEQKCDLISEISSYSNQFLICDATKLIERLCKVLGYELNPFQINEIKQAKELRKRFNVSDIESFWEREERLNQREIKCGRVLEYGEK